MQVVSINRGPYSYLTYNSVRSLRRKSVGSVSCASASRLHCARSGQLCWQYNDHGEEYDPSHQCEGQPCPYEALRAVGESEESGKGEVLVEESKRVWDICAREYPSLMGGGHDQGIVAYTTYWSRMNQLSGTRAHTREAREQEELFPRARTHTLRIGLGEHPPGEILAHEKRALPPVLHTYPTYCARVNIHQAKMNML